MPIQNNIPILTSGGKNMTTQTDTTAWRFPSNDNGQIFGIADSTITAELVRELSKYLNVLGGTYL